MTRIARTARSTIAAIGLLAVIGGPAVAQEISDSHLQAAREAIGAIRATQQFDNILPAAALGLKSQLIQADPNLEPIISATVDEKAIELAGRRRDLETEAARVYAAYFSEDELRTIAQFYASGAGQKLLENGPTATRDVLRAADIWGRGVARDLAESVGNALGERAGQTDGAETQSQ